MCLFFAAFNSSSVFLSSCLAGRTPATSLDRYKGTAAPSLFSSLLPLSVYLRVTCPSRTATYWPVSSDAEAGRWQRLAKGRTDVVVERREEEMDGDMKGGKRKGSWEGRDVMRLRSAPGSLNPTLRRQSDRSSEVGAATGSRRFK